MNDCELAYENKTVVDFISKPSQFRGGKATKLVLANYELDMLDEICTHPGTFAPIHAFRGIVSLRGGLVKTNSPSFNGLFCFHFVLVSSQRICKITISRLFTVAESSAPCGQ